MSQPNFPGPNYKALPDVTDIANLPVGTDGHPMGFDALGKKVPLSRREKTDKVFEEMGVTNSAERFTVVASMSNHVERDNPYGAMDEASRIVDFIGAYRALATILTA